MIKILIIYTLFKMCIRDSPYTVPDKAFYIWYAAHLTAHGPGSFSEWQVILSAFLRFVSHPHSHTPSERAVKELSLIHIFGSGTHGGLFANCIKILAFAERKFL